MEKKPPLMTVEEAYKQLGLPTGKQHDGAIVRKSFYKLAQMYHPDKNPQGRVNIACIYNIFLRIKLKIIYFEISG